MNQRRLPLRLLLGTTQSYRDVALRPLALKICVENNGRPELADLISIKKFICDKIEEAMDAKSYVPIPTCNRIGSDGVHMNCPDSICADWVYEVVKADIPNLKSRAIVLQQSET